MPVKQPLRSVSKASVSIAKGSTRQVFGLVLIPAARFIASGPIRNKQNTLSRIDLGWVLLVFVFGFRSACYGLSVKLSVES